MQLHDYTTPSVRRLSRIAFRRTLKIPSANRDHRRRSKSRTVRKYRVSGGIDCANTRYRDDAFLACLHLSWKIPCEVNTPRDDRTDQTVIMTILTREKKWSDISLRWERNRFHDRTAYFTKIDYERRLSRVSSSISKPLISPKLQTREIDPRTWHEGEKKEEKNTRSRQHSLREKLPMIQRVSHVAKHRLVYSQSGWRE